MLTPFHPAHQAERCFIADDEGLERFHPLGALGPAYRIEDPAQRERLIRITTGFHWGLALGLLLGMVVIGAEWRGKGGDRFAVALLLLLLPLLAYRMALRGALRDCPTAANAWRAQPVSRRETLLLGLGLAVILVLGLVLGRLLGGLF